ncbi:hypothetical protein CYLTODRAFT_424135 [Cylindrobasidium torrendii FP15055 ss-10]|uniref:F-box domain-containing protein n=1 Tax=Cylindrobasidium torrendii FP15055 ss-10 TaxID=1314674 RepID=A0A0D7B665_9AGAR|nr:hypothetical protein CYLTODRAFT_424135 [Cylindrobasidium torrendii FP15055 ss-10]
MCTLSSLPSELLYLICEFAWTPDAPSSLPLVSLQFNAVTQPLRFRCVAITKWASGRRRLESMPVAPIHRVRHLFVSLRSDTPPLAEWVSALKNAAPSLQTLCVDIPTTAHLACIYRIKFPVLEALTLNGFYSYSTTLHDTMPSLRTLHLAGHRNPVGLLEAGLGPQLEVLRLSGISAARTFAQEVGAFMDGELEWDDGNERPNLRKLVIELGPEIPGRKVDEQRMQDVLRKVEARHPQVTLLPGRMDAASMDVKTITDAWNNVL